VCANTSYEEVTGVKKTYIDSRKHVRSPTTQACRASVINL